MKRKLFALFLALVTVLQLVTPVFAEEIEETQAVTETVEVETEAPVTQAPEPTAVPEHPTAPTKLQEVVETTVPTEPQTTTEVTEVTASTEETAAAANDPTEGKNVIASGACGVNGDNLTWVLTEDGTLTISGSGDMDGYNHGSISVVPWDSNQEKILSAVMEPGVTSIGAWAFRNCSSLTSITIPEGVTSIGSNAFSDCSSLTSVTIPNGVKSIGHAAFYGCSSLTSVTIPEGVTSIGWGAFKGCSSLTSVTILEGVTSIGSSAFQGCGSLTSVTIPDSVTSIGEGAFKGCSSLTSVTILEGVTSIGSSAFQGCGSLTSVTIPDSVTSIGEGAFRGCGLTSVAIPEGVTSIGDTTFYNCGNLTSVTIPKSVTSIGSYAFFNCGLTSVTIPEGVKSIDRDTFSGCSGLMSVTIPESVKSIGDLAFCNCSSLTGVTIPKGVTSIGGSAFSGCSSLRGIFTDDGNPNYASVDGVLFDAECTTLAIYPAGHGTVYQIPDSVTSIGSCAFSGCSSLTSVTIPDSVTSIGSSAFWGCSSLTNMIIPESVTSIGIGAFGDCGGLTSVTILAGVTSISDDTFTACSSLTSVVIPEGVTSIDYDAFSGCSSLASVTIPKSVTSIGNDAFYECNKIADVCYGGTEEEWQAIEVGDNNEALYNAIIHYDYYMPHDHNLQYILGKAATCTRSGNEGYYICTVCGKAFKDADGMQTTTSAAERIPALGHTEVIDKGYAATCTETGLSDGKHCSVCETVLVEQEEIPATGHTEVVDSGYDATCTKAGLTEGKHCSVCETVLVEQKEIPATGHTEVVDSGYDATCTKAGLSDGKHCSVCETVLVEQKEIPALGHVMTKTEAVEPTCSEVGNNEYYTCSRCGKVYKDEMGETETTVKAETLEKLAQVASGTCGDAGDNLIWELAENGTLFISGSGRMENYNRTTDIPWYSVRAKILSAVVKDGVTSIGEWAFRDCRSLTSVTIPEGVTSIGYEAFCGCSRLTSVTIPEGVTSIGGSAFLGCRSLASIVIPEGITCIEEDTFSDCTSLASVSIPESVTSIGKWAFNLCGLTSVAIPDGVLQIESGAFNWCQNLTSVTISESVSSISGNVFYGCKQLESILVSEKNANYTSADGALFDKDYTTLIAYPARRGNATYKIPESVTIIGMGAFSFCSSLTNVTIPNGVTLIGANAFEECSNLISVKIPESVVSISDFAFAECTSLIDMTIPESVTSIGAGAFGVCSSLTSVTIPEGVTSINSVTFTGCSSLTSVTIPEGVTSIGNQAFYKCVSLTSVKIPKSVTSIGDWAFQHCSGLTSVTIPEGVTSIGEWAFQNCSGLTSVVIPKSLTYIASYTFDGCDAIADVYYSGTEEEWKEIQIGRYNDILYHTTIHYNSTHNPEHIPGKAATCTEAGSREYWHCFDCGEYFADEDCTQVISEADTVLSALGHDMTKVDAVKPTYSSAGHNEYYICSRCGKVFKDAQGEIETTVEAETLKGIEVWPVDTTALISRSKLMLTARMLPGGKKAKVKWSLASGDEAYATISSSGVLMAKTVNEVQNITVIATPTDGSPEARKTIQILPKITVKQVEKFNLFYRYGSAELSITGGEVSSAQFVEPSDFVLDSNDGKFYIRLAENASTKPNTKATLEIQLPGCDTPIKQPLTIATTNTAPKLKLNPTASIVNTTLTGSLTVETAILGTDDKTLTARSATSGVTASVEDGILTLKLDTAKTTTANVYIQGDGWAKEVKVTHKVTFTNKTTTVKFTAKGKLDVLNPASEIVYTPKLTNATGTITDVSLEGPDANLFNAEVDEYGFIHLTLAKPGENYSTKTTYKVTPKVILLGNEITGPTLSIKVTQSAVKLAKIPNQTVSKSAPEDLTVYLKITSPLTAQIGDVQMNAKTTTALRNASFVFDGETGSVTFPAATFTNLKAGKYTMILDVTPANAASDSKPVQAKFTLTVQK